jgi:hypothetical protein
MAEDKRPRLDEILSGVDVDFNKLWESTAAAGEFEPLPSGRFKALVANGELAESRTNKTPSYKLTLEILEPPAFAGRKLFHDLWLTAKALATSKRDLAKLRIVSAQQLRQPPPTGIIIDVKVALRTADDGGQYNRVVGFQVIGEGTPPGILDRDADELAQDDVGAVDRDADGFDWRKGEQRCWTRRLPSVW